MAKERRLRNIEEGEYIGTVVWQSGSGIEERTRYAESVGVKVDSKWVYVYLRDGEDIVKLSRTRNTSASVYINMTLREVFREKIINRVTNSGSCCWGIFGMKRSCSGEESLWSDREPCSLHTQAWLEDEIDAAMESMITDDQWPSVLAQRQLDAVNAADRLKAAQLERENALQSGMGEWRNNGGEWVVSISNHSTGDIVSVRRRNGNVSNHKLTAQITPTLFRASAAISDAEVEAIRNNKVLMFPSNAA